MFIRKLPLSMTHTTATGAWQGANVTTGGAIAFTAANWSYKFTAVRSW